MTRTKILAGVALGATMGLAAPAAFAQNYQTNNSNYDGYCYAQKDKAKTTGTVVGAVAGGLLGSQISKNERGLGTVGGAVIGGAIGRSVGANSVKCYNGSYYSYQSGNYTPAPAPDGYDVVYYQTRPSANTYDRVYYDASGRMTSPQPVYNSGYNGSSGNSSYNNANNGNSYNGGYASASGTQGWRDTNGNWHTGRPAAFGWKDSAGRWHVGQFQTYGYKDRSGNWHESSQTQQGYNSGNNGY